MIQRLRLLGVLSLVAVITLLLLPIQAIAVWCDLRLARKIPIFWHRCVACLMGLRIVVKGTMSRERPLLLVANHLSWCDIVVLSCLGEVCFIAKAEVSDIPFVGLLARLQRCVFVTREDKRRSGEQANMVAARLLAGDAMVLFAEGTTGDGNGVLDFKSSLFGAAQFVVRDKSAETVFIQPVSIAYTHCYGIKMGRLDRARTSWPGDVSLAPHASKFIKRSAWDVEVTFLEPIPFDENDRRRTVANAAQTRIASAYRASVFGR